MKLLNNTQYIILSTYFILYILLGYRIISNPVNHIGIDIYLLMYFFIFLTLLSIVAFVKTKNKISILTIIVGVISNILLFLIDEYNILVGYEKWLQRGMPNSTW